MLYVVVLIVGFAPLLFAQNPKPPIVTAAPVPTAITAAKKVFISNGGGVDLQDALDFTIVGGGLDHAYDQFYAAIKNWGKYDLVPLPSEADVVFKISFMVSDSGLERLAPQSPFATITPVMGQLRLTIVDPKTRVTLWTIADYAQGAVLQNNREKNFNRTMDTVVDRLKALVEPPATGRP